MTEWIWEPTAAKNLRPRDTVRDRHHRSDPARTVLLVDRFDGDVFVWFDGEPDYLVFLPEAPLERRVSVDAWMRQQDALHDEWCAQEAG